MSAVDKKSLPKCWSQRLWWIFLLFSLVVAYLVLHNFEMGYWTFLLFLALFVAAGTAGGHYLGVYIDRNHRSEKGLFRQEKRLCRSLHKWMHSINRRKGDKLAGPIQRKLEDRIKRLGELGFKVSITEAEFSVPLPAVDKYYLRQGSDYKKLMKKKDEIKGLQVPDTSCRIFHS